MFMIQPEVQTVRILYSFACNRYDVESGPWTEGTLLGSASVERQALRFRLKHEHQCSVWLTQPVPQQERH
jgi:hypothetical protein